VAALPHRGIGHDPTP